MRAILILNALLVLALTVGCTRRDNSRQETTPNTTQDTNRNPATGTTGDQSAAGTQTNDETAASGATTGFGSGAAGVDRSTTSTAADPSANSPNVSDSGRATMPSGDQAANTQPHAADQPQSGATTGLGTDATSGSSARSDVAPGNSKVMGTSQQNVHIQQDFKNNIQKRMGTLDSRIASLKSRANQQPDARKIDIKSIDNKREDLNDMMADLNKSSTMRSPSDWEKSKVDVAKAVDSLEAEVKRAEGSMK